MREILIVFLLLTISCVTYAGERIFYKAKNLSKVAVFESKKDDLSASLSTMSEPQKVFGYTHFSKSSTTVFWGDKILDSKQDLSEYEYIGTATYNKTDGWVEDADIQKIRDVMNQYREIENPHAIIGSSPTPKEVTK